MRAEDYPSTYPIPMNIAELRQRAESGSIVAQSTLGICYLNGIDVEVDYQEALQFLSAAVERRAPRAAANLARMYAEGLGVPTSMDEAIRLYELAANKGEFLAQVALGRIYSRSVDVPSDPDAALRWYSAAVGQENQVGDCEELNESKLYLKNRI
jgi:TPR repeat protein